MTGQQPGTPKLCRYRCPICGERRERLLRTQRARRQITNDLVNHVRMTANEGHGPQDELPDGEVFAEPSAHVTVYLCTG
ncbi:MAG: hypothetical protein ABEJ79_05405 [Halolamina sp.]